jgi:hypothetical protein
VNRTLYPIAVTASAAVATMFVAAGTAFAATPAPVQVSSSAMPIQLADDDTGHNYHWHLHNRHARAGEIMSDYFGGSSSAGGPQRIALMCPDSPPPGVSQWKCAFTTVPPVPAP